LIELDEIRLPTLSERETLELQTEVLSELALEGSARRVGAVFCGRLAHRAGADRCILFAREFRASGDWTVIARSNSNAAEGIETASFRIAQEAAPNTMRHATAKKHLSGCDRTRRTCSSASGTTATASMSSNGCATPAGATRSDWPACMSVHRCSAASGKSYRIRAKGR
jgi:hypothetical protein